MSTLAKRAILIGAILLLVASIGGLSASRRGTEKAVEEVADDDSGDDDSGPFGQLDSLPKANPDDAGE